MPNKNSNGQDYLIHKPTNSYTICLEDFVIQTIIGILPNEREKAQKICIDAEFVCVWNPSMHSNDTKSNPSLSHKNYENIRTQDFLDYRILRKFIKESFTQRFGLLEEALSYFYDEIPLRFPQIQEFWIKITKQEVFEDCKVSIKINRQI